VLYLDGFICFLGILCGWLLFRNLPNLSVSTHKPAKISMSIIIPARNEEKSLMLLLDDLKKQTVEMEQIICVDDGSTDETAKVAKSYGATLLSIIDKPQDWTGKSYACQTGADHTKSELLLFLDADVRLKPDSLQRLYTTYQDTGTVISVQPFHTVKKWYEQLCLFFNLISVGALGINRHDDAAKTSGLFGPLILIPKKTYEDIGGHASVKGNILEDMTLGEELDQAKIPYKCFIGGNTIAFRMYPDGIQALAEGFIKNFAAGAMKTSLVSLLLVIIWISALFSAPIGMASSIANHHGMEFVFYAVLYVVSVIELFWIANQIGAFKRLTVIFYPVCLLFFTLILMYSFYKKLFKRPVKWKGRQINEE